MAGLRARLVLITALSVPVVSALGLVRRLVLMVPTTPEYSRVAYSARLVRVVVVPLV
jgi:hypothetical protein